MFSIFIDLPKLVHIFYDKHLFLMIWVLFLIENTFNLCPNNLSPALLLKLFLVNKSIYYLKRLNINKRMKTNTTSIIEKQSCFLFSSIFQDQSIFIQDKHLFLMIWVLFLTGNTFNLYPNNLSPALLLKLFLVNESIYYINREKQSLK